MNIVITNLATDIQIVKNGRTELFFKGAKRNMWHDGTSVYITDETKLSDSFKSGRYVVSMPYGAVSPTVASANALVTLLLGYYADYTTSVSPSAPNISTTAVITAITTDSNWSTGAFVDPGGILAQITSGQGYTDVTNKVRYYYDGTTLIRWNINNL